MTTRHRSLLATTVASLAAGAFSLTGCMADGGGTASYPPPDQATPLAAIDAYVGIHRGELRIDSGVTGCPRIDPGLSVTVAGELATVVSEGGRVTVDTSEPGHKVTNCDVPRFELPAGALQGIAVITIADDSATWTIQFDHPGVDRGLTLEAPATAYRPGDTLRFHMEPAGSFLGSGSLTATATATGEHLFTVYTHGADVSFTVPVVAGVSGPTEIELEVTGQIAPAVLRCEGPNHCVADLVAPTATVFMATLVP